MCRKEEPRKCMGEDVRPPTSSQWSLCSLWDVILIWFFPSQFYPTEVFLEGFFPYGCASHMPKIKYFFFPVGSPHMHAVHIRCTSVYRLYFVLYTLYFVLYTLYFVLCTLYFVLCTLYFVLCTLCASSLVPGAHTVLTLFALSMTGDLHAWPIGELIHRTGYVGLS